MPIGIHAIAPGNSGTTNGTNAMTALQTRLGALRGGTAIPTSLLGYVQSKEFAMRLMFYSISCSWEPTIPNLDTDNRPETKLYRALDLNVALAPK